MSIAFARTDTSILGRWWWTVDRWTVGAVFILMTLGVLLIATASLPVAERIGYDSLHFVRRHLVFLPITIAVMVAVSLLTPRRARRLALIALVVALVATALTLLIGAEIKGARRWLDFGFLSIQPSEFLKPCFVVTSAWLLAEGRLNPSFPGRPLAVGLCAVVLGLLLAQPDLGMTALVATVWGAQLFLAGLPAIVAVGLVMLAIAAMVGAYYAFEHVASRVDRFLDPSEGDNYQVNTGLEAFMNGGLFGRGPGEGLVKDRLPDAHSDFIFAVAGEELGLLACLFIVALFGLVLLRGLTRLLTERHLFIVLATGGLLIQIALQAFINMASSVHLMPTKGMTLPFISYGGSSLIAEGLTVGLILAFTRRRIAEENIL